MCIGIPARVIECDETSALVDVARRRERLNVMLVGAQAPGTWLLAYQGSAVRVLADDEAQQTRAALAALEAANAGSTDLDLYFADLTSREPTLPPHLRPAHREAPE